MVNEYTSLTEPKVESGTHSNSKVKSVDND